MCLPVVHSEIHIQNGTGRVAHPFQNVFVGQILLSTVTGEKMSESVKLVLLWILEANTEGIIYHWYSPDILLRSGRKSLRLKAGRCRMPQKVSGDGTRALHGTG